MSNTEISVRVSAAAVRALPTGARVTPEVLDAYASGLTGDGLECDMFMLLVAVAERYLVTIRGNASNRAAAIDLALVGLRENLDDVSLPA